MSNTYRHRPARYRPESERENPRNYWRPRADAAELRTLRRRDRAATRQTIRTAARLATMARDYESETK